MCSLFALLFCVGGSLEVDAVESGHAALRMRRGRSTLLRNSISRYFSATDDLWSETRARSIYDMGLGDCGKSPDRT